MREIEDLARPGRAAQVARDVAAALESYSEEDFGAAADHARSARRSAPRSPRVSELLGLCLYRTGEWKAALSAMLDYRRWTGAVDENHVVADLYRALGRPEKALEATAEVKKDEVEAEVWAETMIVAAAALADQGDPGRAIRMLARGEPRAGVVEPYVLRYWYVRADLLEQAGRMGEARTLWERIAAEDPEFFDVGERLSPG